MASRIIAHSGPAGINVDPYAGYTANGKLILPLTSTTGDSVQEHLDTGRRIQVNSEGEITYGFYTGNHALGTVNDPHSGEGIGYSPFSAEQKAAAIAAIELWDELIPQSFVNVGDISEKGWAHNDATIIFANTSTGPAQAWAYYPGGTTPAARVNSDVWTADPAFNSSNSEFGFGQYGNTTLIHEIGHTLGLSHPGEYNFSDDNDGDGEPDPITYEGDAQYFQDSQEYTIMSYFGAWETGGAPIDWRYSGGAFYDNSPQGPMLHDIFVIQQAYGADPTTRADGTTYGFHSTAGNALYDFNQNSLPYYALYDAGGEDTIDLSGFTSSQYLNLNAGAFSSIGDVTMTREQLGQALHDAYLKYLGIELYDSGYTNTSLGNISLSWLAGTKAGNAAALAGDTGVSGIGTVNYENFAIAYGTLIENAVGGQGRDLLVGNTLANHLDGQAGNDVLKGGGGDDTLTGGAGTDALYGQAGNDTFVFTNNGSTDTIADFATGADKIDLTGVSGVTAADVSYNSTTHQLQIDTNHDATYDMFINIVGSSVATSDILFHA